MITHCCCSVLSTRTFHYSPLFGAFYSVLTKHFFACNKRCNWRPGAQYCLWEISRTAKMVQKVFVSTYDILTMFKSHLIVYALLAVCVQPRSFRSQFIITAQIIKTKKKLDNLNNTVCIKLPSDGAGLLTVPTYFNPIFRG